MGPCQGCAASLLWFGAFGRPHRRNIDITYNISQTSQSASPLCPPGQLPAPSVTGGVVDVVGLGRGGGVPQA